MKNKVAVVVGGTSGVNFGIARAFGEQGARVAVLGRNPEKAAGAAESLSAAGINAMPLSADVRDYEAVEMALQQVNDAWGDIDIVVSGAAGNFPAGALDMSPNGFKAVVDIDLIGTYHVFRACFPHLRKPGASLISISAAQAVNPRPLQSHVCAAKAGVNMLTLCLAMEWGPAGVRVNAISPGPIAGTEGMRRLTPTPEDEQRLKNKIPLRRYGEASEIGDLAVFLCGSQAAYITGAILNCDGGSQLGDASRNVVNSVVKQHG